MSQLLDREELHRCYDLLSVGICIIEADAPGTIVFANRELIRMYDCGSEDEFLELTGGKISGLSFDEDIPIPYFGHPGAESEKFHFTYLTGSKHIRSADGIFRVIEYAGESCHLLQIMNWQMEMKSQSSDELTGFPGISGFYAEALKMARERTQKGNFTEFCPVWFNIANFRGFNRENGTEAGNRCISYTASVLKKVFPEGIFSRTEADNFCALLPRKNLEIRIDEACATVNRYMGKRSYSLKAGIVRFDGPAPVEVIRHSFDMARMACSSIKNDGEHSYAFFRKEMEEQLENQQYIIDHFDQALEQGYIKIYYQPVVRTLSGKVCSYEALARWEDPKKGMISPAVFVPVLEKARRIGRLDQFVIEHTVQLLHTMAASGRHVVPVSLNLSQLDFDLIQPLQCLNQACEKYHVPHDYFHVEITETVVSENQERVAGIIRDFQADGYEVWLDDFGSGYSSLKSLNKFPFNLIKLDMDFFRHFDDRSRAIVTSIVIMAKRLRMHTLAEGVETEEQLEFLREIGCERIQGFYYGKPEPGISVYEKLSSRGLEMENRLEKSVYEKAGLEDLLSDDASALFLCENGGIRLLTCNDAYRKQMKSAGIEPLERVEPDSSGVQSQFRKLYSYLTSIFDSAKETQTFIENGEYIQIHAAFISGVRNFWIGRASLQNIRLDQEHSGQRGEDLLIRNVAQLVDGMYYLAPEEDRIEIFECTHPKLMTEKTYYGIRRCIAACCRELVHVDDQARFLEFMGKDQLSSALGFAEHSCVQDLFRIRREDGSYQWSLVAVMSVGNELRQGILVCEYREFFDAEGNRGELLNTFIASLRPEAVIDRMSEKERKNAEEMEVMLAFIRHSGIPLFWKDRRARYLGVNTEMLTYLGQDSADAVIGKTADELGVFVDAEQMIRVNERVLNRGDVVCFNPLLIVGGAARQIPVTELPWYRGNQIMGVVGWVQTMEERKEQSFILDAETGFLNEYGALLTGSGYDSVFRGGGRDYCVVYLALRGYEQLIREFGGDFAGKSVRTAAETIRKTGLPQGTAVAHLSGCRFLLIGRDDSSEGLEKTAREIQAEIRKIREIDGVECHFEMDCAMSFGSETSGFAEQIRILEERADYSRREDVDVAEQLNTAHRSVQISSELLDTVPELIMITDPENYEILFLNQAMKRELNLPEDFNYSGKKCYSLFNWKNAPCRTCGSGSLSTVRARAGRQQFRENGQEFHTRESLVHWKGKTVRICVALQNQSGTHSASEEGLLNYEMWANESITSGMAEKNPSTGIQKTVEHIAWNLQAERFLVFEERPDQTVSCSYEWKNPKQPELKWEMQSIMQKKLLLLYRLFETNKIVMIPDYTAFCREHPDFDLPLGNVRNAICGHLVTAGKSIGFIMILNVSTEYFSRADFILSTLNDFLAVMIQNRSKIEEAIEQSQRDPMTGVRNRAGLRKYLEKQSGEGPVAIISGDINGLKVMNDSQGHLSGDRLILGIAAILVRFADADHVFRMGGDEFLVIREGMDDAGARELIRQIRHTCLAEGFSIAMGYTIHSGSIDNIDDVLKKADQSMYEDKGRYYHRESGAVISGQHKDLPEE